VPVRGQINRAIAF
jgi:hypothetical protein